MAKKRVSKRFKIAVKEGDEVIDTIHILGFNKQKVGRIAVHTVSDVFDMKTSVLTPVIEEVSPDTVLEPGEFIVMSARARDETLGQGMTAPKGDENA